MPESELQKFLTDTNPQVDLMEQPLVPEKGNEPPPPAKSSDDSEDHDNADPTPRNRRERRLTQRLNAERASSIRLAEQIARDNEARRLAERSEGTYFKKLETIYGNTTAEAMAATDILKGAIQEARELAKQEAIEAFRAERQAEIQAEREAEAELENMVEEIEDEFNLDLTEAQRKAFFKNLERMSPKRNGEVVEYADHFAVWEDMQSKAKQRRDTGATDRSREVSSRSMTTPGASTDPSNNATEKYLRDNGII